MIIRYLKGISLITILLTSCYNKQSNKSKTVKAPTIETVDNNFNDFIEKFSADSTFQYSRTRFPLKIKWYDIENEKDSILYKDSSGFEVMDFRKKKSTSQYDQWEQKIVIEKNNRLATIEIRGIENGIMVEYLFEKINEAWMLVAIVDTST